MVKLIGLYAGPINGTRVNQFIVDEACFGEARAKIESFLTNDQAQSIYRAWQEKGQELHSMSQQGLRPSEEDLASLESLKQAVTNNKIAAESAGAERQMNDVFDSVTKLLQKTLGVCLLKRKWQLSPGGAVVVAAAAVVAAKASTF